MQRRTMLIALFGAILVLMGACSQNVPQQAVPELMNHIEPSGGDNVDLHTGPGGSVDVNGAIWNYPVEFNVGTGLINPFLGIQASGYEEGFNTDASPLPLDTTRPNFTNPLPLNHVPTIKVNDDFYREIILDGNENNSGNDPLFAIRQFDLWMCDDPAATTYDTVSDFESNADCTLVYDLDGKILRATTALTSGSGKTLDYQILIPEANFQDALSALGADPTSCTYAGVESPACGIYLVLYSAMGATADQITADPDEANWVTDATFEEFSTIKRPYVTVDKTANSAFTRTYEWTIEKTVDPDTWDLFNGETGTSEYTVTVTKTGYTDSGVTVTGNITIVNPSDDDVVVVDVTDELTDGVTTWPLDVVCPVTLPATLEPDDELVCTYSSNELTVEGELTNTAYVELEELGTSSVTIPVDIGDPTTEVNDTINVDDTYAGDLGEFSDTDETTYTRTFTCDADEGTHGNTATIVETGQSDDADVTVNCYEISVTKDADPELTRTFTWDIEKSSETVELTLQPQATYDVDYEIRVFTTGFTDSDWFVSGQITVNNPHPSRVAEITAVSDVVSPAIAASVDCGEAFPYDIAAGGSLVCDYEADLPDDASRTNTATATQQLYDFDEDLVATAAGTTDRDGTANVDFANAIVNMVDECVDVADLTFGLDFGTVCVIAGQTSADVTFYSNDNTIGPFEECGPHQFENVAQFVTNDTGATGTDNHVIDIDVPCPEGCTLTLGYWKTHNVSFHGGASKKADPTWDLLPGGLAENTIFFLSGQTWYEVFWTNPAGNVYYNLAHQYMAAVLNGLAGADTSSVDDALTDATALFNTYTPAEVGAWKGNQGDRKTFVELAGILGSYNEGLIGPGHCDENEATI
jgi:hypothetical protein